jgi:hypothetical protein
MIKADSIGFSWRFFGGFGGVAWRGVLRGGMSRRIGHFGDQGQ